MSQSPEGTATAGERKYKGVRRRKWGKWVSEIRVPGSRERLWLGSYTAPEAAAVAHDTAVFFLRGPDWAHCLNFPDHVAKYSWAGLSPRSIQSVASESGMAVDAQLVVPGPQALPPPLPPPPPPAQRADVGAVEDANRREAGEYGLYDGSDFGAYLCFEGMDINDIDLLAEPLPASSIGDERERESWSSIRDERELDLHPMTGWI